MEQAPPASNLHFSISSAGPLTNALVHGKFAQVVHLRRTGTLLAALLLQLLPSCVSGVQLVPILDVVFVLLPAEEDFATAEDGGEINQAAL
jgi:hypothetical protein